MSSKFESVIAAVSPDKLTAEVPTLLAWQMGVAHNMDDVAQFMYRGGPYPPQAGPPPKEDHRPEKRYWQFVKEEMHAFLCKDDPRFRELWNRLADLESKTTPAIVAVTAAYLGQQIGAPATLLTGFVAVCLYGAAKLGKEAYCRYLSQGES